MINKKISAIVLPLLVSGFYLTSASASQLVDAEMERISPDKESGSGHTVIKTMAGYLQPLTSKLNKTKQILK